MISHEDLELAWSLLDPQTLNPGELDIRTGDESINAWGEPLFGVDSRRFRHLLLPVPRDYQINEDTESAGVQIKVHELFDGETPKTFVDIACYKPHLNKLFTTIVVEILSQITEEQLKPDVAGRRVLDRWRELLEKPPSHLPDLKTITGLFAELETLRRGAESNINVINCWQGPRKARHDFSSGHLSLEVKATRAIESRIYRIHGTEQLETDQGKPLYLAALRLEQVNSGGLTIKSMIDEICRIGVSRSDLLPLIADAGISEDMIYLINYIKFVVKEFNLYHVDRDFPKITSDDFSDKEIPSGVQNLTYDIDLSRKPPYPLSTEETSEILTLLASGDM